MSGRGYCDPTWLVSGRSPLVPAPLYRPPSSDEIVACTNIRCAWCGEQVVNRGGARFSEPSPDLDAAYAAVSEQRDSPLIVSDERVRLYLCRCQSYVMEPGASTLHLGPIGRWQCGGHEVVEMVYCEEGPYLTPPGWPEPKGPSDYQYRGRTPVIGCNRLECGGCASGPLPSGDEDDGKTRVYRCICGKSASVSRPMPVPRSGWEDLYGPGWRCGGHPKA